MKTVEEWAQELPEDVREKFLANVVRVHGEYAMKLNLTSLSDALIHSFNWAKSPQGITFWRNIHDKLKSENR